MSHTPPRSDRVVLALGAVALGLLAACARSGTQADSVPSAALIRDTTTYRRMIGEQGPTVFTDTALFRQHCVEADSGLTAKTAGKCTPRDQGVILRPRDVPRRVP